MLHTFPTLLGPAMSNVLCESTEREMWQISSLIMKLKRYFSLVTNTEKRKNAEFLIVIRPQTLGLSTVILFHYDFLTSPSLTPPEPPPSPSTLKISYSPHFYLYISQGADKENLFNNQELP